MTYIEILIVLVLILLNGFFAMSELAVVSARKARLKARVQEGSSGAAAALHLANEPSIFLPTVQVGITLVGVLAGAFGGATIAEKLAAWLDNYAVTRPFSDGLAIAIVVGTITYLSLIVGELVPKQIALRNAEGIAVRVARPLRVLARIASPAVWLLKVSSNAVLRLLGMHQTRRQGVTEEEVSIIIAEGAEAGVLEPSERRILERVLRLDDRTVQTVMTPRRDAVSLDVNDTPEMVSRKIRESGHSRFPVCQGTPDNVLGIAQARDLLQRTLDGLPFSLRESLRQAPVLHEGATLLEALEILRSSPVHMAIVVDEYGSVQGVVTITDLTKAMVGTIRESEIPEEPRVQRREDGSWLLDGLMPVAELKEYTDIPTIPEEGYHTLAGFVMAELGRVPVEGDALDWGGWRFEVVDMDGRRIDKIVATAIERVGPPLAP